MSWSGCLNSAHKTLPQQLARAEHERDRYRDVMREALDIMGRATDSELGEGGVARKAYAHLWHAYHAIPAGIATPPSSAASGDPVARETTPPTPASEQGS